MNLQGTYDVVVVGARCAGAATAMLLARAGLRVLVVDRGRYGSDTLSTHALMRGGVLQLRRWGLLDRVKAEGTPAVRRTSFYYGDDVIDIPIKAKDGVDALYAPRRTVLDRILVDGAVEAGAQVVYGPRVTAVSHAADGSVSGVVLEGAASAPIVVQARLVIGADGLRSTVARLVGAGIYRSGRHATAVVYGYWSGLDIAGYRWYYRPGVSGGAIPTNDGQTLVFAAIPARRFREEIRFDVPGGYHRVLAEAAPDLAVRLQSRRLDGTLHGFPGEIGYFRRSWGPGWALVGDAAYFKDPLTAHGITDALRDAELLARAVLTGHDRALADYQRTRDDHVTRQFEATDAIASFEWDLQSVRQLHHDMSDEMAREVRMLARLDSIGPGHPANAEVQHPVSRFQQPLSAPCIVEEQTR